MLSLKGTTSDLGYLFFSSLRREGSKMFSVGWNQNGGHFTASDHMSQLWKRELESCGSCCVPLWRVQPVSPAWERSVEAQAAGADTCT